MAELMLCLLEVSLCSPALCCYLCHFLRSRSLLGLARYEMVCCELMGGNILVRFPLGKSCFSMHLPQCQQRRDVDLSFRTVLPSLANSP